MESFDEFVTGASPRLLRAAYLLVGDRTAAEDLLQDVLEKMCVTWARSSPAGRVDDAGHRPGAHLRPAARSPPEGRGRQPGPLDPAAVLPVQVPLPDDQGTLVARYGSAVAYWVGDGPWLPAGRDAALLPASATAAHVTPDGGTAAVVTLV